jgi:hypothetical protein
MLLKTLNNPFAKKMAKKSIKSSQPQPPHPRTQIFLNGDTCHNHGTFSKPGNYNSLMLIVKLQQTIGIPQVCGSKETDTEEKTTLTQDAWSSVLYFGS